MNDGLSEQLQLLPLYLGRHLQLTLTALACGLAISMPLAVLAVRRPILQAPLLAIASAIQTIPGLALLALMVPLLGRIGYLPAVIALTLYSLLPVLRNTVAGLSGIAPELIEAGRGIGMTESQLMQRVRFPLAMPVIVAGIRIAAVWTVGMATLSTPVGATSLGNFIFSGLQTQNHSAVLVGCIAAALLALLLDGLIRLAELGLERRSNLLVVAAGAALIVLVALGLAPVVLASQRTAPGQRVVIASKPFTEQYILAELIAMRLHEAGFSPEVKESVGSTVAFDGLVQGSIDLYVDYSGTVWANYMKRTDMLPAEEMNAEIAQWLSATHGAQVAGGLGFENAYALAMRRPQAQSLGIASIRDLAKHAPRLKAAGDYEFFQRPEWASVRDSYRLNFTELVTLDPTLMYSALEQGQVDVISAYSTDGRIAAMDLLVLDDPQQALPPYDALVLLSPAASANAELVAAIEPLIGAISDSQMRQANKLVDLEGQSKTVAAEYLAAELGSGE